MIVSVHQPHYIPWSGYFDKIDSADVFVDLDTVQYEKNGWQNRNKIKTASGWMWVTVPVRFSFGMDVRDVGIVTDSPWRNKHLQAFRTNYSKAPYFDRYAEYFAGIYDRDWPMLVDLTREMLGFFLDTMGITTEVIRASSLGELPEEPNERLAAIVGKLGGDVYLAGSGSRAYINEETFDRQGIRVVFQDYRPAEYPQLFDGFIPGLSVVDQLFNTGDDTLEIIRSGRRTRL